MPGTVGSFRASKQLLLMVVRSIERLFWIIFCDENQQMLKNVKDEKGNGCH